MRDRIKDSGPRALLTAALLATGASLGVSTEAYAQTPSPEPTEVPAPKVGF